MNPPQQSKAAQQRLAIGDKICFWHTPKRRCSGVIYAETPAHSNSYGIPVAQNVSVTVRFGGNHVSLAVDVDFCRAELCEPNIQLHTPHERP